MSNLLREFQKRKTPTTLFISDELLPFRAQFPASAIVSLGPLRAPTFFARQRNLLRIRCALKEGLDVAAPRVIHAHLEKSLLLLRSLCRREPIVFTLHGWEIKDYYHPKNFEERIIKYVLACAMRDPRWTITTVARWQVEDLAPSVRSRIVHIPNGVNTTVFRPGGRTAKRRVLFVGRLVEDKGVRELIAAARLLPDVTFRVVGYGPLESAVRGPNVEFVGFRTGPAAVREFQQATLCCFPSKMETFAIVALEAMACAVPVVATKYGFAETMLDGKTGVLLEDRTPEAIANAIRSILSKPAVRAKMARAARQRALAFDWGPISEQYLALYHRVGAEGRA